MGYLPGSQYHQDRQKLGLHWMWRGYQWGASQALGGISELRVLLSPASRAWPSLGPQQAAAAARGRQLGCAHSQSPSLSPGGRRLCKWDAWPLAAAGTGSTGKVKQSVSLLGPLLCC